MFGLCNEMEHSLALRLHPNNEHKMEILYNIRKKNNCLEIIATYSLCGIIVHRKEFRSHYRKRRSFAKCGWRVQNPIDTEIVIIEKLTQIRYDRIRLSS